MSVLLKISCFELMKLWAELVECYHGVNGFGSATAEIYAYRFRRDNPIAKSDRNSKFVIEAIIEGNNLAADALTELCRLFQSEYECKIKIDGLTVSKWRKEIKDIFDHRAHVEVIKK